MRSALMSLERHNLQLKMRLEKKDQEKEELEAQIRVRDGQIADAEKREADADAKVKQQRQMYDQVRADRNLLSKHLIEAQDEIAELRRKFKIMARQVDQLKEDVSAKDRALVAVHFDNKAASKRLDDKAREGEELRAALAKANAHVRQLTTVVDELNGAIRKMDEEAAEQKRKIGDLLAERDVLGAQLIRRNDELALLHEKIEIMSSILKKGEAQYRDRDEDVRILRIHVRDLRRQLSLANRAAGQVGELQREVVRLQQEIMQERTKVKALSEELENPMNVHRWRKLEGSDPATYELIQKVQTLQKRLINKTEEVVEKELLIQEKERLYVELKEVLARQPGPEVAEQLSTYQQSLRSKTRQMKALAGEVNMYQAQASEFQYEVERLTRELQEARRRYYDYRRKEAIAGQRAAARATEGSASAAAGGGGGGGSLGRRGGSGLGKRKGGRGNALQNTVEPPVGERLLQEQREKAQAATAHFAGGGFNARPV